MREGSRPDADRLAGIALGVAVGLFLAIRLGPSLIGQRVFLGMDALRLFSPWNFADDHPITSSWYVTDHIDALIPSIQAVHERAMSGDWPSWSSLSAGGQPLLSGPSLGLVSPARWVYLVLPTWLAPAWSKLLELAFSAAFTYLFARRLNASRLAAALAGVIYPLTGFMIGWTNYPQVAVGAVIPMLFWAVERYVALPSTRAAVPVALAAALLMFGGFPAVAGQAFYAGAGYAVVRVVGARRAALRERVWQLGTLGAAVVLGVCLSGFQLLPFAHQLGGTDTEYRSSGFFNDTPLVDGMSTVLPKTFGTNQLCCASSPQDMYSYVGAVVLLLVLIGTAQALAGRMQRGAGVYLTGLALAVIVLVWLQGPLTDWMDALPILHGNPIGRVRSQLGLPVAVLAGAGLDALRGRRWSEGWWRRPLAEARPVAAGAAVAVCAMVGGGAAFMHLHRYKFLTSAFSGDVLAALVPVAAITALILLGRFRAVLLPLVLVSVVFQGFLATTFYWPTSPRSQYYPSSPAIAFLQGQEGHDRIATTGYTLRVNATAYYGLRTLNGHVFLPGPLKNLLQAIDANVLLGPTYAAFTTVVSHLLSSPGLDRAGVRYVVAGADDVIPGTPDVPVPVPGTADDVAAQAGALPLVPGQPYQAHIAGGALRAVNVPVTAQVSTLVQVTVQRPDGSVLATNSRHAAPGYHVVPVSIAADPGPGKTADVSAAAQYTVTVSVNRPGASATTDAAGSLRVQAVRPPPADTARLAYAGYGLQIWELLGYVPRIHWADTVTVGSSRVDLQACKLEYSIVSPK